MDAHHYVFDDQQIKQNLILGRGVLRSYLKSAMFSTTKAEQRM